MSLTPRLSAPVEAVEGAVEGAVGQVREVLAEIKPRLRGWLHLGTVPLALVAGIVLIALSPTATTRAGSAVFIGSSVVLFTVSATYHRGSWSPRTQRFLRRCDHASIFLLIAGSYTAFGLLLLRGAQLTWLLSLVWAGALLGIVFRVCWVTAPRWLHTPLYVGLGWVAVAFTPGLVAGSMRLHAGVGTTTLILLAAGGALYTLGGVVYGFQRPNPWPRWFGFHEVFHTLTVLAFASHLVGVSLATLSLR